MKTNTYQQIVDSVKADMAREQVGIDLFLFLRSVLVPFEGKKITKVLANAVEKAFGGTHTVDYQTAHGMFHLNIYKAGTTYAERQNGAECRFLLAHDTNPTFRMGDFNKQGSGFEYYSGCYGQAARERNEKRQSFLADLAGIRKMAKAIDELKAAKEAVQAYSDFDMPSWYSIEKATGIKERS